MDRATAVKRINQGLRWLPDGNAYEPAIILALQEAQRDLERGKTLPYFLRQVSQTLTLTAGTSSSTLPTGFIRDDDDERLHYTPVGGTPFFLRRIVQYQDALEANIKPNNPPASPKIYVIRNSVDFITTADKNYTLTWSYYKAAQLLTTNIENEWLANAPEWLIGEAGERIALDMGNAGAVTRFIAMKTKARAAIFGSILDLETSGGAIQMGENN